MQIKNSESLPFLIQSSLFFLVPALLLLSLFAVGGLLGRCGCDGSRGRWRQRQLRLRVVRVVGHWVSGRRWRRWWGQVGAGRLLDRVWRYDVWGVGRLPSPWTGLLVRALVGGGRGGGEVEVFLAGRGRLQ